LFLESSNFRPELTYLAVARGDAIAGAAICHDFMDIGWVGTLGVRRPWRRSGVGLALLHRAFGDFYDAGRRRVYLGVDAQSLTGATRLYERAGMHPERRHVFYEKVLRDGVDLATRVLAE
jgi:GNAT superfamily N-acetyltransferase